MNYCEICNSTSHVKERDIICEYFSRLKKPLQPFVVNIKLCGECYDIITFHKPIGMIVCKNREDALSLIEDEIEDYWEELEGRYPNSP